MLCCCGHAPLPSPPSPARFYAPIQRQTASKEGKRGKTQGGSYPAGCTLLLLLLPVLLLTISSILNFAFPVVVVIVVKFGLRGRRVRILDWKVSGIIQYMATVRVCVLSVEEGRAPEWIDRNTVRIPPDLKFYIRTQTSA